MSDNILEMRGITKQFPATKALDNVNFAVKRGSIHALVGENGAGKSTLMKVLSGLWPYGTYTGDIVYNGEICKFSGIKDSEEKGIVIIHQELALVPYMSIGENMFLGNEKGKKFNINWNETYAEADKYLKIVGLTESSKTLIKDIGVGKQQLTEIAKALAKNAKLLILDEPTSSLNESDSQALLDLLLEFKKNGMTSIIISHKLNEVSYVADDITVLRDGKTIETLRKGVDDISEARIIRGMVGREIADRFPKRTDVKIGDVALEIENWNVYHPIYTEKKVVDNVSLNVRKGEVVGISGLMGAGRTELAMSVFGRSYGSNISGTVKINGKEVKITKPINAMKNGISYLPEDRKRDGIIGDLSVRENLILAHQVLKGFFKPISRAQSEKFADEYIKLLEIKTASTETPIKALSGGNQQKVLLARALLSNPEYLILDEPTRGIDIGTKTEIQELVLKLAGEGKSVTFISSEIDEMLRTCSRLVVMRDLKQVGELTGEDLTQTKIMKTIAGGEK